MAEDVLQLAKSKARGENDPETYFSNEKERLYELGEDIYYLMTNIRVATKPQLWAYFKNADRADISKCLHKLVKERQLYVLPQDPDEEIDRAHEKYVTDERVADPERFRSQRAGTTFSDINDEEKRLSMLDDYCEAFWLFLTLRDNQGAAQPCALYAARYPNLVFTFSIGKTAYEVYCVHKGREGGLATLRIKDMETEENTANRIFLIDDESQIPDIEEYEIGGIKCFAVMAKDGKFSMKKPA